MDQAFILDLHQCKLKQSWFKLILICLNFWTNIILFNNEHRYYTRAILAFETNANSLLICYWEVYTNCFMTVKSGTKHEQILHSKLDPHTEGNKGSQILKKHFRVVCLETELIAMNGYKLPCSSHLGPDPKSIEINGSLFNDLNQAFRGCWSEKYIQRWLRELHVLAQCKIPSEMGVLCKDFRIRPLNIKHAF